VFEVSSAFRRLICLQHVTAAAISDFEYGVFDLGFGVWGLGFKV
jgi:hypothetical protein